MRDKAHELTQEYAESSNAIKMFCRYNGCGCFYRLFVFKREIAVLKDFIDNVVYGLSDSAKAFIIILFTDIFVGFHSPHGWEVLLSRRIPTSRTTRKSRLYRFVYCTFPVILDTVFKYWIFRYLSRISPSAVATYRNMNE